MNCPIYDCNSTNLVEFQHKKSGRIYFSCQECGGFFKGSPDDYTITTPGHRRRRRPSSNVSGIQIHMKHARDFVRQAHDRLGSMINLTRLNEFVAELQHLATEERRIQNLEDISIQEAMDLEDAEERLRCLLQEKVIPRYLAM